MCKLQCMHVAGITVSQEQLTEARERVSAAGLQDRIDLVFCDYREVVARYGEGVFDAVVSCEMIEAVGHEHLPIYFDIIGQVLKPGGLFAMQVCSNNLIPSDCCQGPAMRLPSAAGAAHKCRARARHLGHKCRAQARQLYMWPLCCANLISQNSLAACASNTSCNGKHASPLDDVTSQT